MAKKTLAGYAALSLCGALVCFAAHAQESAVEPVDPTALVELGPPAPDPAAIPSELSVLSATCTAPASDIANTAPALARTIEKISTTKQLRILTIGSSSTWGVGASSLKRNYPSRLEAILSKVWKGVELEIVNRGVSAELAAQTASRLIGEVELAQPDLVLWQLGTNDALSKIPLAEFEATVRTTVTEMRKRNIDIALVGLQYTSRYDRHEHYFAIRKLLDEIAASENLLYVRRYKAMEFIAHTKANLSMMAGDNFHLNDLGYQCMAEHVAQAVIANLFVRKLDRGRQQPGAVAARRPN